MLDEASVDSHFRLVRIHLFHRVRNASPKTDCVGSERVTILWKIEFERWVAYNEIEFLQHTIILFMRWFGKRVALHHIRQRSRKVIENKIQTQHLG